MGVLRQGSKSKGDEAFIEWSGSLTPDGRSEILSELVAESPLGLARIAIHHDNSYSVVLVNSTAYRLFRVRLTEPVPAPSTLVKFLLPDDQVRLIDSIWGLIDGRIAEKFEILARTLTSGEVSTLQIRCKKRAFEKEDCPDTIIDITVQDVTLATRERTKNARITTLVRSLLSELRKFEDLEPNEAASQEFGSILSRREREVHALVQAGLTNAEIAQYLDISESTVKKHINSIFSKLGVGTRGELARLRWRVGLGEMVPD